MNLKFKIDLYFDIDDQTNMDLTKSNFLGYTNSTNFSCKLTTKSYDQKSKFVPKIFVSAPIAKVLFPRRSMIKVNDKNF